MLSPAFAEKRVALVIGNNVYPNLSEREQLRSAVSDAEAVKAALESLNFKVDIGENLDRAALVGKLSDFGARLEDGDIAFFFYAGHGVSFSGANYILPTDIPAPKATGRGEEERLADLAVPESRVADRIHSAGAKIAVVVLDACRDNPLATSNTRSIGGQRGLAPPLQTDGALSIYSAKAGQKALDNLGDDDPNSVFTRVFVKELRTPGIGLRELAFKTQGEVAKLASAHGYDQVPGVYSEIVGDDVYLSGRPAPQPSAPAVSADEMDFRAAMESGSVAQLDSFLAKHPASPWASLVRSEKDRLAKLADLTDPAAPPPIAEPPVAPVVSEDEAAWEKAKAARSRESLQRFVRAFPDSKHRREAELLLASVSGEPAKPHREPQKARASAPAGHGTCFEFNGERVCQ
jgi:hypothetical protein